MTDKQLKIRRLFERASYIEMADHMSAEDFRKVRDLENEANQLIAEGENGWCIKRKDSNYYLIKEDGLCYSDAPIKFESQQEAEEVLKNFCINYPDTDMNEFNICFSRKEVIK